MRKIPLAYIAPRGGGSILEEVLKIYTQANDSMQLLHALSGFTMSFKLKTILCLAFILQEALLSAAEGHRSTGPGPQDSSAIASKKHACAKKAGESATFD